MGTTIKHCARYKPHAAIPDLFHVSCSLCTWRAEHCLPIDEALAAFVAYHAPRQPRHWLAWTPDEFDAEAPAVQLSMFAAPDPLGTADLFGDQS